MLYTHTKYTTKIAPQSVKINYFFMPCDEEYFEELRQRRLREPDYEWAADMQQRMRFTLDEIQDLVRVRRARGLESWAENGFDTEGYLVIEKRISLWLRITKHIHSILQLLDELYQDRPKI